ncbi:MAG: protein-glutamate O-methyltransferase [Firmicutes bacterium]|nr:protein-glutamate O-methyltransferase [Bacillota bacterium]
MSDLTDAEFAAISDYIRSNFGISLGPEKKSLVYSRLSGTLREKGFESFTDYFDYLVKDRSGEAVVRFIDKVTTNHTFFMREENHFDFFRESVLPELEENLGARRDIRLWCAGCSSGEEPYTLQMILHDRFAGRPEKWDTKILATDISTLALEKAAKGVYSADSVKALPEKWRKAYFEPCVGGSIISASIRNDILFRKLNLMDAVFPFKAPMHVIFCRNVMIYFDNPTKDALVQKFWNWLVPGGYLFVGHAESLSRSQAGFRYIIPAVYQKPLT